MRRDDLPVDARFYRDRGVGLDVADGVKPHRDGLERDRNGGHGHRRRTLLRVGARAAVRLKDDESRHGDDRHQENPGKNLLLRRH